MPLVSRSSPVDQAGRLGSVEAERAEQPVQVSGDAAPALHRQAGRLVQRDHVGIAVDDRRLQHGGIGFIDGWVGPAPRALPVIVAERWHAHPVAGRKAGAGAGALAVHPDLAGAQQLLQAAVAESGVVPPEPAVEPLVAVLRRDLQGGDACHQTMARTSLSPQ